MLLTAVFPLLAVAAGVLGQDTQDDCAVRAYVRAADLRQNEISYGELRVKLIGSACAPLARVGLRLTLDEYAQSAPLPAALEDVPQFRWEQELSNFTVAGAANISAQERAFSAGVTWNVHGQKFDSEEGFIKPFSVAMPNIRYPTGVFPVKFSCAAHDQKIALRFGRVYRYIVWILMENGKYLGAPAGYTSFAVNPTGLDNGSDLTSLKEHLDNQEMKSAVSTVSYVPRVPNCIGRRSLGAVKCCHDDAFPATIPVKVSFPQGNVTIPGRQLVVQLELLEPEPVDSETHVIVSLGYHTRVVEGTPLPDGVQCSEGQSQFNTLSSPNGWRYRISNRISSHIVYGVPTVATLDVGLDSSIDAPGAFFTSTSAIDLRIIRRNRISTSQPHIWDYDADKLVPEGYAHDGLSPTSGRWAYDSDGHIQELLKSMQSYEQDIQLQLFKPKSVGLTYQEAFGSAEQPIMAPTHVQTWEEAKSARARFEFRLVGQIDIPLALDSFVGQYVGALWTAREQDLAAARVVAPADARGSTVAEQVVFH